MTLICLKFIFAITERKHKRKRVSVGSMSHSNRTKVLYPPVKHPTRVNHCIGPSTSQKPHPGHASSNIHQRSSTHLDKQRTQKLDSGIPAKSIDDMDRMDSSKSNRPERTGIKMISALPAKGYTSNKHDNFSSERLKPVKSSKVNNVISLHETTDSHSIKTAGAVTNPTHHVADANYHHRNHPKSLKNGTSYERKSGEKTFVQPLVSSHKSKKIFSTYHHHYHQQSQDSSSDSSISSDIPDVKASTIDPQSLRNVPRIVLSKTPVPTPPGSIKILPHSGHKRSRQASGNSDNFTSPSRHKMPMLQSPDRNKTPAREMSYQMPNSVSTTKTKEPKRKDMRNIPLKGSYLLVILRWFCYLPSYKGLFLVLLVVGSSRLGLKTDLKILNLLSMLIITQLAVAPIAIHSTAPLVYNKASDATFRYLAGNAADRSFDSILFRNLSSLPVLFHSAVWPKWPVC